MKILITENKIETILKKNGTRKTYILLGRSGENFRKVFNIETPMDYLYLFNDLEIVKDPEYPNWFLFVNESKYNLIAYNMNKDMVYIHLELVWYFLMNYFNMTYQEIQVLTEEWLSESYNLTGVQTHSGSQDFMESL